MFRTELSGCSPIFPQPLGPQTWEQKQSHILTSILYLAEQEYALSGGSIEINLFRQMLPIKIYLSKIPDISFSSTCNTAS